MSDAVDGFSVSESTPYSLLPTLQQPTVAGHRGELRTVSVNNKHALIFLGRTHLYEGGKESVVCDAVDYCVQRGISHILFTNACGGLNPLFHVGDVMLCSDVLNVTGRYALQSSHRHNVIDTMWTKRIAESALQTGVATRMGSYVQVLGPSYETRAEIHMLRKIGADVVGMSTVVEASYAASLGVSVAVASVVTNVLTDARRRTVSHAEVLEAGRTAVASLATIINSAIFAV